MNWGRDGYGWMDGRGMLFMGFFWILILCLGIWFITWMIRREKTGQLQETPRQILDRRYASGEIDAGAYAQARTLIEGRAPDAGESK